MESSRRYTHHGATDVSVHTTTTIGAVPQSVGTGAIPAPTLPPPPRNGGATNHPIGVAAAAAAARAAPPVSLEASTAAAMATAAATTAACTQEPHAHPQQDSMEAAATPGVEQSKNTKPHTDPFAAAHNNNNNSNSSVSTSKAISSIAKNSTNSTITNNNYKTNNINETNTKQQPPQQQHRQRRRSCRFPGCDRVIKSQGHCQRHGARAKRCRFPGGCDKQAQGTHDGLCKRHWRAIMYCPEQEEEDDDDEEEDSDEPENPNNDEEERHGIGNTTTLRQQQGGAAIGATFHPKSAPQKRRRRRHPVPQGDSVYDAVVPQSIAFRPATAAASLLHHGGATTTTTTGNTTTFSTRTTMDSNNNITNTNHNRQQQQQNTTQDEIPTPSLVPGAFPHNNNTFSNNSGFVVEEYGHPLSGTTTSAALSPDKNNMEGVVRLDSAGMDDDTAANNNIHNNHFGKGEQPSTTRQQSSLDFVRTTTNLDPWDVPGPPDGVAVMPLVLFLRQHAHQDAGWHRNQERRARGVHPVPSLSSQLEPWERQLALVEILLLSGGTPYADFRHLR